jgi:hypothetical protein
MLAVICLATGCVAPPSTDPPNTLGTVQRRLSGTWRAELHIGVVARFLPPTIWNGPLVKFFPERPLPGLLRPFLPSRADVARGDVRLTGVATVTCVGCRELLSGESAIDFRGVLPRAPIGRMLLAETLSDSAIVLQVDPCCEEGRITMYGEVRGDTISGWWQQQSSSTVPPTGSFVMIRQTSDPIVPPPPEYEMPRRPRRRR